jgi:predicted O-methyltransferase YrrM
LIETTRKKMIRSRTYIDFTDFGGGQRSGQRKISELASRTAREAKYGQFLYRLLSKFNPEYSIELGTGTGITALYQACALSPNNPIHTIEGSAKLTEVAKLNAEKCGLTEHIVFHTGRFEEVLPKLLNEMPRIDYAYIDGNHRYEPTMDYFELLLSKCHNNTVLVFDDINWSEEMKQAWRTIKNHPQVTLTVDIFAFGIVFFRKEQEKEHFTIRY